jgi:sodium transport system permease protein
MKRVWIIFQKEVLDNLRDRRTITSSMLTSLFTPALLLALIVVLGRTLNVNPEEKPLSLPVIGAENAPGLIDYLKQNNVEIAPQPLDPEAAVKAGALDVVLVIPADFGESFTAGKPASVQLIVDSSRQAASASIRRVRGLIGGYSQMIGSLRVEARGVDLKLLNAVSVAELDVATPQSQALILLNMMPFLIILNIFVGGMNVIIDATAGERERGSLEPLLINPVRRWEFVVGKLLASLPYALFTLGLVLFFMWLGFSVVPVEDYLGFPMRLDAGALLTIYALCLPMVLLASALQMLIATFTRSFKEAQTYLSFLPLVAGLPGIFISFLPVDSRVLNMLIPSFSQSLLIDQILRGDAIEPVYWITCSLATLLVSGVLVGVAIRLYEREQVLVGR